MTSRSLKRVAATILVVTLALVLAAPASAAPRISQDGEVFSLQPIVGWLQVAWSWTSESVVSLWGALGGEIDPDGQQ